MESIIQTLYGSQAKPLIRVVHGAPATWESSVANARFPTRICTTVWSSCSRFIAIAVEDSCNVVVLDGATLGQLHTMYPQSQDVHWNQLMFSLDGHLLTAYSYGSDCIVSWDLQTGGLISNISVKGARECISMTYSECGTMLGVLFDENTIITYNTSSGIQISSHSIQQATTRTIWTFGEHLQFATTESGFIMIWQVGFTSDYAPIQVGTLPTPDNFQREGLVLLPALCHLAFIYQGSVVVWDAQHEKVLLNSTDVYNPWNISFSPDGNFLTCGTTGPKFYLWKRSPDGYFPYGTQISTVKQATPVVSPSGELIISFGDSTIVRSGSMLQLWHVTHASTSPSISTQPSQHTGDFLLEFFPDQPLVAIAQRLGKMVTILNINSGNPQLVINTDVEICGIGTIGRKIVVVCDGNIVTWELPAGDWAPNVQWNIENSVQTTKFELPGSIERLCACISPDLNYIAFGNLVSYTRALSICDIHTGKKLVIAGSGGSIPAFTLGGNEIYCATGSGVVDKWAIVKHNGSEAVELKQLWKEQKPQNGFFWHSPCGHQVTDDGWVLNSRRKQLLWLPHQWQSMEAKRKWSGKFLAMFPNGLPEPLILELEV